MPFLSILIVTVGFICTSGIATQLRTLQRLDGVGMNSLWVAGIDIYAMVKECVLQQKPTGMVVDIKLHTITWTRLVRSFTSLAHPGFYVIKNDYGMCLSVHENKDRNGAPVFVSDSNPTRDSSGNGYITSSHIINMGNFKCILLNMCMLAFKISYSF